MIINNMAAAEYFSHPAVNNSLLKLVGQAPQLAKAYLDGAYTVTETPAMKLGTLVHCLVLEPSEFSSRYIVAPECDRRTKAGKEAYEAFLIEANGKEVVTVSDYDKAQRMAESVRNHPSARLLIDGSESEVSVFSEIEGTECKCRIDIKRRDGIIADLKTCASVLPDDFARQCANLDYIVAAPFYMDVASAAGIPADDYIWIAVESSEPYLCATYSPTLVDIETGRMMYRNRLETLNRCRATGEWPGIGNGLVSALSMPGWWNFKNGGNV